MSFSLHPRLDADTFLLGDLPLCRALLMNDSRFPWLVLVPRRADIREIHQLPETDQFQLLREITQVSAAMETAFSAEKMNVAALGNMVPQLHIHIIARFEADEAWPGPIWGVGQTIPYADETDPAVMRFKTLMSNVGGQ
ncbi:HIT family protein [Aestuariispira insulae]|nr:HIT domain-containing protein [Aestuariispira insulae]